MLAKTVPVPEVLKGRLKFGDVAQIEALKAIEKEIAEQEERTQREAAGELKEWNMHVEISGDIEVDGIWAVSEKEAREIVESEEVDYSDCDLEFNVYRAREVKGETRSGA